MRTINAEGKELQAKVTIFAIVNSTKSLNF